MINRTRAHGFTLIEVIIVIAILAILAGAMAPLAIRALESSREDQTLKRQQAIYRAILGDASAPGSGFLSDIGRLPIASLTELATQGALPSYGISASGVGAGWRGPYILEGVDGTGRPLDGWGIPMDFVNGQIRSAGPDHSMATNADNFLYPPTPIAANNANSGIVLTVLALDTSAAQPTFVPAGGQINLYYAQNGAMQSLVLNSASGVYSYPPNGVSFPQGIHAVDITADPDGPGSQPAVTRTITIYCPGGGTTQQTVALR
jgi:prepilin-type N-terminal cleavage/methylation domain-containing protein